MRRSNRSPTGQTLQWSPWVPRGVPWARKVPSPSQPRSLQLVSGQKSPGVAIPWGRRLGGGLGAGPPRGPTRHREVVAGGPQRGWARWRADGGPGRGPASDNITHSHRSPTTISWEKKGCGIMLTSPHSIVQWEAFPCFSGRLNYPQRRGTRPCLLIGDRCGIIVVHHSTRFA